MNDLYEMMKQNALRILETCMSRRDAEILYEKLVSIKEFDFNSEHGYNNECSDEIEYRNRREEHMVTKMSEANVPKALI